MVSGWSVAVLPSLTYLTMSIPVPTLSTITQLLAAAATLRRMHRVSSELPVVLDPDCTEVGGRSGSRLVAV